MGAIMTWIVRGLFYGGGAAIGYFFNDVATWFANVTGWGTKTIDSKTGRFAWWFVLLIAVILGGALYLIIKMVSGGKKKIFMWAVFALAVGNMFGIVPDLMVVEGLPEGALYGTLLFSVAASASETEQVKYLPEFITFNISSAPTNFTIEVAGDGVIFKLDATGMINLNGIRCVGALATNQYLYQVADGFIGKNTTFTITNAAAAQLDVYGFSNSKGGMYVTHNMATALANSTISIDDFGYAAFPSAAATDLFTITWADGTTEQMRRQELEAYISYKQEVSATRYNFDNLEKEIKRIQFNGAAQQSVYYTRFAGAKGTVNQVL
jgi:hypothetical protein